MNIRWSVKEMPELATLTNNERQNIMWDSSQRAFRHWQSWVGIAVCVICSSIGGHLAGIMGATLGGGIGGGVCAQIVVRMQMREIREELAKRKDTSRT